MTIEDPPWKKRTRPCPFYSQGRCLFADACNFMHTVTIRRPDSVLGSEDSDQPDFRLVVDSPTRRKSVRFSSPHRSPRTTSLLLALGDAIQHEDEEDEWDEGESGELESSSGEGSEGRTSEDSAYAEPAAVLREARSGEFTLPGPSLHSDAASDTSALPTPILVLSDDARRLLHCIPSPPRHPSPHLPEASITDGSATLVDGTSTRSGSPTRDSAVLDEEGAAVTPEDPRSSIRQSVGSDFQDSPDGSAIVSDYFPSRRGSAVPDLCATPSRRGSAVPDLCSTPSRRESEAPVISPPSRRASAAPSHSPIPSTSNAAPVAPESLPLPPSPSPSLSPSTSDVPDIHPPTRSPQSTAAPRGPPPLSPRRLTNSHASSSVSGSSRDSLSSVLLSPIDLLGARRISYSSVPGSLFGSEREGGDAEGPHPRTPRRLSTLSMILASPFGSPSARIGGGGGDGVPSASALFSPRFGAFPGPGAAEALEEARHSRGDSVDSQLFAREEEEEDAEEEAGADEDWVAGGLAGAPLDGAATDGDKDVEIQVQRQSTPTSTAPELLRPTESERDVPADPDPDSSLFSAADAPDYDYLAVDQDHDDDGLLRAGEASFTSDESTMTSLYDQYYTPTVHSSRPVLAEEGQDASPTMVLGSFARDAEQEGSPVGLPYADGEEEGEEGELLFDERGEPEDDSSPYDLGYLRQPEAEEDSLEIGEGPQEASVKTVMPPQEPLPLVFSPPGEQSPEHEPEPEPEALVASPDQPLVAEQEPEMVFSALQEQSPDAFVASYKQPLLWDGMEADPVPSSPVDAPEESSFAAEESSTVALEESSFVVLDFYDEVSYVEPDEPQEDSSFPADDFQHAGPSSTPVRSSSVGTSVRSPSVGSSVSEAPRVFSPIQRPPSSASSVQVPNFSLPNSARNSIVFAAPSRAASPAVSVPDDNAQESTSRPPSSLSQQSGGLRRLSLQSTASVHSSHSSQSGSKKVPFGFRNSMSFADRPQPRRSDSLRHKPPPLLAIDRVEEDTPSRSATPLSPVEEMPLTESPPTSSASNPRRLKPLRLSMILSSSSSALSSAIPVSSSIPSLTTATTATTSFTPSSPTVLSNCSIPNSRPLSLSHSSIIPSHLHHTSGSSQPNSPLHIDPAIAFSHSQPSSAPETRPLSWHNRFPRKSLLHRHSRHFSSFADEQQAHHVRSESRSSEPIDSFDERQEDEYYEDDAADQADETVRRPVSANPSHPRNSSIFAAQQTAVQQKRLSTVSVRQSRRESVLVEPVHAIATPRPTLLFALASDDVEEVRRVLESGEAGVNDDVGPQSALAFTLSNPQLKNKMQMVKLLLAYGADTSVLHDPEEEEWEERSSRRGSSRLSKLLEDVDPATRYYIERADSPQTRRASALIHRSYFRPLTRVRYDLIGQDRVLEQLFRVLSMPSMAPIVVLLCGPSGHGKSLLARKFGSLLEVPTHTVNMTTLQNTGDIWKSHSIAPYGEPSNHSLKEFLIENEGKRCVVVLDEIEKTQDEKILSSLLMPWEYGRCSFEAGYRHVDVSKVIWLGTSNIGHDLVFEHQAKRPSPDSQLSREEYIDLMTLLRPRASDRLGPSLLSRVTAVLPFVVFTADEKLALAAEALHGLVGESVTDMPPATRDLIVRTSLNSYIASEGARSLYRAVSTLLLDTI